MLSYVVYFLFIYLFLFFFFFWGGGGSLSPTYNILLKIVEIVTLLDWFFLCLSPVSVYCGKVVLKL